MGNDIPTAIYQDVVRLTLSARPVSKISVRCL